MKQNLITDSSLQKALSKIGATPSQVLDIPTISEAAGDSPIIVSQNLATQRAEKLLENHNSDGIFVASSKIAALGNRILPVATNDELVRQNLQKISGRRHKVYVSVCFIKKEGTTIIKKIRTTTSILKIKRLTEEEIENYVKSKQGLNMPGGHDFKRIAASFVIFFSGSLAPIQDLPLYETRNMLLSLGFVLM
ncbi:Maf-like protein [Candidatus Phycorickettsia trachydisci]|uniref:Maf-like protein n=1 Tax=Candidatus Phycorickettsia trachydisci TaxID=2115978 RepID=A0A2P1PA16_9RICK|nr:Maf family protein [Candidatus Phycorickettsia trachydisci]AVP88099.1 Maf-like protein [Candidatus Phycorickettsia trachydisci]